MSRIRYLAAGAVAALTIGPLLASCSSGEGKTVTTSTPSSTPASASDLVCGLVSRSLIDKVVGDARIDTSGSGVRTKAQRAYEPANCTVRNAESYTTFLNVVIGEYDRTRGLAMLDQEAKENAKNEGACTVTYTGKAGEPGEGYGCQYDQGVFANGAGVAVMRGDRLIRVVVYQWSDATPQQRLALAEDIARDADRNLTAYDRSSAAS